MKLEGAGDEPGRQLSGKASPGAGSEEGHLFESREGRYSCQCWQLECLASHQRWRVLVIFLELLT